MKSPFTLIFVTALLSIASAMPMEMDDNSLEARQLQCGDFDDVVPFYHLFNPQIVDHFYTTNTSEANTAIDNLGYNLEGISSLIFTSKQPGTVPFYRLYNPSAQDHFYTITETEGRPAYSPDGIAGYIYPNGNCANTVPFYRLYSASYKDHFYTTSASERDSAMRDGYISEDIAAFLYMA